MEAAISAKGKWLAVDLLEDRFVTTGEAVMIWNRANGKMLRIFEPSDGCAGPARFSPDGKVLAVPVASGVVRLLNSDTGRDIRSLQGFSHEVLCLEFSPSGDFLAAADRCDQIHLWCVSTGQCLLAMRLRDRVRALVFSPDGRRLATGGDDRAVRIFEVAGGKEVAKMTCREEVSCIAFSTKGDRLLSGETDGTVRLWEVESHTERWSGKASRGILAASFSHDSRSVWTGSSDGRIFQWDTESGVRSRSPGHEEEIRVLCYSPDGARLLSADDGGRVILWESASGRTLWSTTTTAPARDAAYSPGGGEVAVVGGDGSLRIQDAATGAVRREMSCPEGKARVVKYHPSGDVVSGCEAGLLHVWRDGELRKTFKTRERSFHTLAVSPDGHYLAATGTSHSVIVWNAEDGQELGHEKDLTASIAGAVPLVAFSSDGRLLATARFTQVVLREPETGRRLWSLDLGEETIVTAFAFAPDGRLIVGSLLGMQVIDLSARRVVEQRLVPDGVTSLALRPDGRHVATGGSSGLLPVWWLD